MKSLQNQYNLIKEGKGNKELFLKEAKAQFPQYITNVQTFNQVIHSLTEKGIINENITLVAGNKPQTQDWFKIFNENVKAELKDTDKEVEEMETRGYNYKEKNNNNISTAEMLKGYYVEMRDPKHAEKTEEQIKAIVVKNLEKDPLFYVKDGEFGVKGLGYKSEHPGLPKDIYGNYALGIEPKVKLTGKYKSSGMEPVKLNESLTEAEEEMYVVYSYPDGKEDQKELYRKDNSLRDAKLRAGNLNIMHKEDSDIYSYMKQSEWEAKHGSLSENKYTLSEAKKRAIEKHIKEIEKMGEVAAWDHRITKIQEKIEELTNKMTVTEGDDVKDMVDKKAVKELKKDIALLTKKKALYEKQKSKAAKKVTDKSAMQTAAGEGTTVMEEEEVEIKLADRPVPSSQELEDEWSARKPHFMKSMKAQVGGPKKESWSGMVRELINKKNLKVK
jgi:hypothetical protein